MSAYAWKNPGIGIFLTYMGLAGIMFFAIIMMIDLRVLSFNCRNKSIVSSSEVENVDGDVKEEKEKVADMSLYDLLVNNLVLHKLRKFYGKFLAVNQVSLVVQRCISIFYFLITFIRFKYLKSRVSFV